MATTINAGRVAMVPKGTYDESTAYERLDVVTYGGKAWVCKADSTGNEPVEGSDYWQLISSRGEQGSQGIQGEEGPQGERGIGIDSVSTPDVADGTVTITLTDGNTITLDLNHTHTNVYTKTEIDSMIGDIETLLSAI